MAYGWTSPVVPMIVRVAGPGGQEVTARADLAVGEQRTVKMPGSDAVVTVARPVPVRVVPIDGRPFFQRLLHPGER